RPRHVRLRARPDEALPTARCRRALHGRPPSRLMDSISGQQRADRRLRRDVEQPPRRDATAGEAQRRRGGLPPRRPERLPARGRRCSRQREPPVQADRRPAVQAPCRYAQGDPGLGLAALRLAAARQVRATPTGAEDRAGLVLAVVVVARAAVPPPLRSYQRRSEVLFRERLPPAKGADVMTELAHRRSNGLDVALLWSRRTGRLVVAVS